MCPDPKFRPRTGLTDAAEVSTHHRASLAKQQSGVGCGWPLLTPVVVSSSNDTMALRGLRSGRPLTRVRR